MAADGEEAPSPGSLPRPLPSYPEMILEAIGALDNEKGSNKTAISGYIKSRYGSSLPPAHTTLLTAHLGRMRPAGELVFAKNNYFRPAAAADDDDDEEEPGEAASADTADPTNPRGEALEPGEDPDSEAHDGGVPAPASVVAADAGGVPAKRGRGRPPKPKVPVAEATIGAPAAAPALPDDADGAPTEVCAADANAMPVKRGRGRPPKPRDPVADDAPMEALTVAPEADVVPVKRGRGRPPKPKDPIDVAVAAVTSGMPRARGRPPKKAKVAQEEEVPIGAPAPVPVKRGLGRRPKVRPAVDGEPGKS